MILEIVNHLKRRLWPLKWTLIAYLRAARSGHRLPPGALRNSRALEAKNRRFQLEIKDELGPIFKLTDHGRISISVIGLDTCRRLLMEHGKNLRTETYSMTSLFPKGILRALEGSDHRKYRRMLVAALDSSLYQHVADNFSEIVNHSLQCHAREYRGLASPPDGLTRTLDNIATGLLIEMYFGVKFGSDDFDQLKGHFHSLGPTGFVWNIGADQKLSFGLIRDFLLARYSPQTGASDRPVSTSVIQRIHDEHGLDEVSLGNLIYMVEMGRFDLYSLFRWLIHYAAERPDILARIAAEDTSRPDEKISIASAFVQETLRMDQSERLQRSVVHDFVFDGFYFPETAYVRLCMWESHKDSDNFSEPFSFNPERFLDDAFTIDQYAPFGLDHHRCPMAEQVIELSTLFIKVLADRYDVAPAVNSTAERGTYHWQPGKQFTVRLVEKAVGNE